MVISKLKLIHGGNRSFWLKSSKPKNDPLAQSIMASEFMSKKTGLGMSHGDLLTKEISDKVIRLKNDKQYNNSAAAKIVYGKPQKIR